MDAVHVFELMIAVLPAVIALHYLAHRFHLPPAVSLLGGGIILAFMPGLPSVALNPELVLVIFLPPLLMDGAWSIPLRHLRQHLIGVLSLAVGAVLFTTLVVAVVAHTLFPRLPWAACAALGAIVSPPDAVSARAVLERVKLPRRVLMLLEGESLLNDASGLVLFRFAVAASVTGMFSASQAAETFVVLALGGVAVGFVIGLLWVKLARRLKDELLVVTATLLPPWAAYMLGERLHVSGVIATVTAGMVCGWYQHVVLNAGVRMRGGSFWAVVIFLMEAAVFMLIGLSLRGVVERVGGLDVVVWQMGGPALLVLLALLLARFVWIFFSDAVIMLCRQLGMRRHHPLGGRSAAVLGWAGVRGVVTLALALSLPEGFAGRDFILVTAFVVILGTVLFQGTTLGLLIRWVGLQAPDSDRPRLTLTQAERALSQAQLRHAETVAYGADGQLLHPKLLAYYEQRARNMQWYEENEAHAAVRVTEHFDLMLGALAAGRAELIRLHRNGEIDEATLRNLEHNLDLDELGVIAAKP